MGAFEDYVKGMREKTKRSNINGGQVVRIQKSAVPKLLQMVATAKVSKRSLVSYAIHLLYEEFIKWNGCDPEHKFGFIVEEKDGKQDQV